MNRVVYKYPLPSIITPLEIHNGFEPLCVQKQNGVACLWALVDTTKEMVRLDVRMVGTGHGEVGPRDSYLGTVQDDEFVWHYFLIGPEKVGS